MENPLSMEFSSWENHRLLWAMASMAMLNNQRDYLVGGIPTPLKNMSSSVGMFFPNLWKHKTSIKIMFQTSNQL